MTDPPAGGLARSAGLLLPLFSMPSSRSWGIGEFSDLVPASRWMRGAGLRLLQLLPLNEMAPGQNSPYSATSAMALDPIFITLADVADFQAQGPGAMDTAMLGLLDHVRASRAVDYRAVRSLKDRALRAAFRRFVDHEWTMDSVRARELKRFIDEQAWWLDDYALFRAAHHAMDGRAWHEWPADVRDRDTVNLDRLRRALGLGVLFRQYLQWIAHTQWQAARRQAREAGVQVLGDFPFGVAADSADTWANQDLFSFDGTVGAPPDAFSDQGQNWQLPIYRWDVLRARGYAWFAWRTRRAADLFDLFRVDHVVGLFRTWTFDPAGHPAGFIPADEPAQIAQGLAVLRTLGGRATVIAEDLGTIPGFVRDTLRELGIPGYRVLRWERQWPVPGQPFIGPPTWPAISLATSGTHDTETLAAWWDSLPPADRAALLEVIRHAGLKPRATAAVPEAVGEGAVADRGVAEGAVAQDVSPARGRPHPSGPFVPGIRDALIEALYASGSSLLTLPIQDIFGWTDRINVPALVDEANWTWKLPWPVDALDDQPEARERQTTLRAWAERHRRR